MNKKYIYLAAIGAATLAAACSEEKFDASGKGSLALSATLSSDVEVVSRATDQELAESCKILISNEKGLVRRYNGIAEVPATIDLVTGSYVAEAYAGDSVSASWDKRFFKGREDFEIKAGETTPVNLACKIANTVVSVNYAEGLDEVLSDYTMTVSHKRGSLTFEGRTDAKGYFMMPSYSKDLTFTLQGKQINGDDFTYEGVIENAAPATEYRLNVTYTKQTNEVGGVVFSIKIDKTEIEVRTDIKVIAAPKIEGYDFDIANPITGEPGKFGRKSVYITSATKIDNVELQSEWLANIAELGGTECSLVNMNETGRTALEAAGINFSYNYNEEADNTIVQINFEPEMLDNLAQGEYAFAISATDSRSATSTATLTFSVSDAPVLTLAAGTVAYHDAVLRAQLAKDDAGALGFNYRRAGDAAWQHIDATATGGAGSEITATVQGLKGNTTYEYCATAGDFTSAIIATFTTLDDQLPNASFEEWSTSGKVILPSASGKVEFWDSGNHGSSTLNKNITDKSSDYKHSGNYSAKLVSQSIVVFGAGKFAAGNIFIGAYLYTEVMDGVLGWGRPFTLEPKEVKLWAKYTPGTETKKGTGTHLSGDADEGIIYIALVDDTMMTWDGNNQTNQKDWPQVVRTNADYQWFFNKNGANVIAYGEHVFTAATEGDGLIEITIPIEYFKAGVTPSNIIFVASASRYGDYFEGRENSTLYIDDIELVY